jgi:hypothetical protein
VNDLFVEWLIEVIQVRNFQGAHVLDRHAQRFIGTAVLSEGLSHGPQDPNDLRPIEPLPFTMLAEAHRVPRLGWIPAIRSALDCPVSTYSLCRICEFISKRCQPVSDAVGLSERARQPILGVRRFLFRQVE